MISSFRRDVNESCDVLGYYAASSGNSLAKLRDNPSVPSSGGQESKKILVFLTCCVKQPKRAQFSELQIPNQLSKANNNKKGRDIKFNPKQNDYKLSGYIGSSKGHNIQQIISILVFHKLILPKLHPYGKKCIRHYTQLSNSNDFFFYKNYKILLHSSEHTHHYPDNILSHPCISSCRDAAGRLLTL